MPANGFESNFRVLCGHQKYAYISYRCPPYSGSDAEVHQRQGWTFFPYGGGISLISDIVETKATGMPRDH